jgi:Zn-dependent protease with chaperone function
LPIVTTVNFDFKRYVTERRGERSAQAAQGAAYAYRGDVQVMRGLARARPVTLAVEAAVRMWKTMAKNDLLGRAVRVTDHQFPELYALLQRASETLRIPVPALYVAPQISELNAHTFGTDMDAYIVLNAALVDHLTPEELLCVIGHECGHIQNNHAVYLTALYYLTTAASRFVRWIVQPATLALKGWSRRAEVTCDRAGLLCTRSLDVSLAALVKLALGSKRLYEKIDLNEYLKQLDEARTGPGKLGEYLQSHPYLPKRVQALKEFEQSIYYQAAIGKEGGVPMEECDARVGEILSVL